MIAAGASSQEVKFTYGGIFSVWAAQHATFLVLPLLADSLGGSATFVGVLVAIPNVIVVLLSVPAGALSESMGRRAFQLTGALAGIGASLIGAYLLSPMGLALAALMLGLYFILTTTPLLAHLAEVVPRDRYPRAQAGNAAVQAASGAFAPALVAVFLAGSDPSRAFIPLAALAVASLAFALPVRHRAARTLTIWSTLRISYRDAGRMIMRNRSIRAACLQAALFTGGALVIGGAFLPLYLVSIRGWEPELAAAVLTVRGVVAIVPVLFFARLVERRGPVAVTRLASLLTALPLLPLLLVDGIGAVVVLLIIQGLGVGLMPASNNLLIALGTQVGERGVAFAAVAALGRLMAILMPAALGLIGDAVGLHAALLLGLAPLLFIFVALVGAGGPSSGEGSAPPRR